MTLGELVDIAEEGLARCPTLAGEEAAVRGEGGTVGVGSEGLGEEFGVDG